MVIYRQSVYNKSTNGLLMLAAAVPVTTFEKRPSFSFGAAYFALCVNLSATIIPTITPTKKTT